MNNKNSSNDILVKFPDAELVDVKTNEKEGKNDWFYKNLR